MRPPCPGRLTLAHHDMQLRGLTLLVGAAITAPWSLFKRDAGLRLGSWVFVIVAPGSGGSYSCSSCLGWLLRARFSGGALRT